MTYDDIKQMPTTLRAESISPGSLGAHESVLRSWHIVNKVCELLRAGTPAPVVLELVDHMRAGAES